MLKLNIEEYKNNIFEDLKKINPILTVGSYNDFNAMTVSWGGIGVLWNLNVAIVYVRKSRNTYKFSEKYDSFTLSFLPEKYAKEVAFFGSKSGRDYDKFKETGLHASYEPDFNGYFVAEANYVIRMKKIAKFDFDSDFIPEEVKNHYPNDDYHTAYFCKIVDILVNEDYEDYKFILNR